MASPSSDSEGNLSDVNKDVPRKRGRPPKNPQATNKLQKEQDTDEEPKPKKSPGRPKGAKNKEIKETPEASTTKRGRGRPRIHPVTETKEGEVKRPRGRPPKKKPEPVQAPTEES